MPRRVSTVSLQCVCFDGVSQCSISEAESHWTWLVFLSRFCADTGSLFLHNLIINYYFKKPFLGGMQHTLFELFEASRGISLFPSHLERVYFLFSLLLTFPPLLLCSSPSCCFSIPVTLKAGSQTM